MYGKRGKKTDYDPWSCNKVANKAIPSEGDFYGCPYKYYGKDTLERALRKRGLEDVEIEEV